jgi:histidine ammonia-lyase
MGSVAARHARTVLEHVERILAIELLVAAQALELRLAGTGDAGQGGAGPGDAAAPDRAAVGDRGGAAAHAPGAGVAEALARIRARVRHLNGDREPAADLATASMIVHDGLLVDLVSATD